MVPAPGSRAFPSPVFLGGVFFVFFFRWRGNYKVQQVRLRQYWEFTLWETAPNTKQKNDFFAKTLTYIKLALWPQLKKQSNQRNQRRGPPGERRILTPLRGGCQLICSLLMKTETLSVPRILT
nr:unnamed protein product [Saccharomyces cerevisiae]